MVLEGILGPGAGSEGGVHGLGSLGGGGEKPRAAGLSRNGGQRLLIESWAKREGDQLQFGEWVCYVLLQGGWEKRFSALSTVDCCRLGNGDGTLMARVLFVRGGDSLSPHLGPSPIAASEVLG